MLKESITYTDFDGVERTEEFNFNLTQNELIKMEMGKEGSFSGMLTKMVNAKDIGDILNSVENFILKAYGEKSADGRRFVKTEELSTAFYQSAAYEKLFDKMINNSKYAYEFIIGIVPADLREQIKNNEKIAALTKSEAVNSITEAHN